MDIVTVRYGKKNGELFEVFVKWEDGSPFQMFQRRMMPNLEYTEFKFPLSHMKELYDFMRTKYQDSHNQFFLASTWKNGSHLVNHNIVRINHERFFVVKQSLVSLDGVKILSINRDERYEVVGTLQEKELPYGA